MGSREGIHNFCITVKILDDYLLFAYSSNAVCIWFVGNINKRRFFHVRALASLVRQEVRLNINIGLRGGLSNRVLHNFMDKLLMWEPMRNYFCLVHNYAIAFGTEAAKIGSRCRMTARRVTLTVVVTV